MTNETAKLAGVIGWPIAHSKSPRLHQYWLKHYKVNGCYLPLAVAPGQLQSALQGLKALGFKGANVTIPYKEDILPLLDRVQDRAKRIGAVNTILIHEDGTIEGQNTDGIGFITHLKTTIPAWHPNSGPVVVLGAGGAARAILVALQEEGVSDILLLNRTFERAQNLGRELGGNITPMDWKKRHDLAKHAALLINTTALGMVGQEELDITHFNQETIVMDIVYNPLETPLLKQATLQGCRVVDGLGMLLHQARPGFHAWFGVMPEVTPELRRFVLK